MLLTGTSFASNTNQTQAADNQSVDTQATNKVVSDDKTVHTQSTDGKAAVKKNVRTERPFVSPLRKDRLNDRHDRRSAVASSITA